MSNPKGIEYQIPEMRKTLQSEKNVQFETHGFSMIPLLHDGGDSVILEQPRLPLKVNDVALCRTTDGRYVLHRVISLDNGGYTLQGDNCSTTEVCGGDSDVVGVACSFIRRGRVIDVKGRKYLFYVRHRSFFLKLWRMFWKVSDFFVRLFRR